jgi:hypothetical protein
MSTNEEKNAVWEATFDPKPFPRTRVTADKVQMPVKRILREEGLFGGGLTLTVSYYENSPNVTLVVTPSTGQKQELSTTLDLIQGILDNDPFGRGNNEAH